MWIARKEDGDYHLSVEDASRPFGERTVFMFDSAADLPTDEETALWADALNVYEATGLTPSQLQARVAELEAALRTCHAWSERDVEGHPVMRYRFDSALVYKTLGVVG